MSAVIIEISSNDFEDTWEKALKQHLNTWNLIKDKYRINDSIIGELIYFYPQGAIFRCDDVLANYVGTKNVELHSKLEICIIGFA